MKLFSRLEIPINMQKRLKLKLKKSSRPRMLKCYKESQKCQDSNGKIIDLYMKNIRLSKSYYKAYLFEIR